MELSRALLPAACCLLPAACYLLPAVCSSDRDRFTEAFQGERRRLTVCFGIKDLGLEVVVSNASKIADMRFADEKLKQPVIGWLWNPKQLLNLFHL